MTKMTRIALAALAVMGATTAMAQSSVTLYGRINTTVERQKIGDNSVTGLYNNASRFGFRGTEDLGGGLKAGFVLESGFNSDNGMGTGSATGLTFKRQSEVNLSGNFGMVRLGNFFPESYFASADYVSMHNHDTGSSSDALYQDPNWMGVSTGGQGGAGGVGTANKIAYRTPSMGGFWAEGSVSLHEKALGTNNKNGYDLAANYNTGPVHLGAGYSRWDGNWQASVRGLYTFGQFTVGGYYQRNDENLLGSRNNFRLSGMYTLGASEFHLNAGRANSWSNLSSSAATQYTVGYNYNLSKRTKVYGYYTRVNNSSNASYGSAVKGADFSSFAVGVRHAF
ncbi:porin [Comamonas sp. w2-DMI]|uniref:Porin n=1 Tax=Comamonas terrae TaxID=673548 RepID=A0ABW5UG12_9BURK|nr:porin [Comamonas terrae]